MDARQRGFVCDDCCQPASGFWHWNEKTTALCASCAKRCLPALAAYPTRAVVVEATWADLERGDWRGKVTPTAACGSVLGWIAASVPFLFCGDHAGAGRAVARLLYIAARRRYREARELVQGVQERRPPRSRNAVPEGTIDAMYPAPEPVA